MKYKLQIEVDTETNEVRISQAVNPWADLAFICEALAVMVSLAAKYKEHTFEDTLVYTHQYLDASAVDYKSHQEIGKL